MKYRQGDVLLVPCKEICGNKLSHLTLARGEKTGHHHTITEGNADLYEENGILYLRVNSDSASLTHQEHGPVTIDQGMYKIMIKREYSPTGWREVSD